MDSSSEAETTAWAKPKRNGFVERSRLVKELLAVILDVRKTFDSAVLLVEQNAGLALTVAERGYLLQNGQVVASGPIAMLRDDRLMRELYLGEGHRTLRKAPSP